ncbi:hypothetical protein [Actinotalea ferrariae]|nr:hypothetical protein [Actinotalea ferrariae]
MRSALAIMGRVLPAKIRVETLPAASAGSNDMAALLPSSAVRVLRR